MTRFEEFASVGDVIECDVQNPIPAKLYAKLSTPEACAFGNELILSGRWRKTPPEIATKIEFRKELNLERPRGTEAIGGDA